MIEDRARRPVEATHLAILNKLDDSLDWLDLATMTFDGSIPLPPHPHELALSRDGRTLYASIYGDGVYGNNVHQAAARGWGGHPAKPSRIARPAVRRR